MKKSMLFLLLPAIAAVSAASRYLGGWAVVTVDELSTVDGGSKSFEGTPVSSDTIFMPSALCNAFGGQLTAYAIQNADCGQAKFGRPVFGCLNDGWIDAGIFAIGKRQKHE